jgi:hypothetical protein
VPGRREGRIGLENSMKSVGRLRWVVDHDRQDLANREVGRRSCRDGENGAEQEALAERVLKNLALIRAYEAKAE